MQLDHGDAECCHRPVKELLQSIFILAEAYTLGQFPHSGTHSHFPFLPWKCGRIRQLLNIRKGSIGALCPEGQSYTGLASRLHTALCISKVLKVEVAWMWRAPGPEERKEEGLIQGGARRNP